jgi:hypothetical protein
MSQWDRYAQAEYGRLASEEEAASSNAAASASYSVYSDGPIIGSLSAGSFHLEDDDEPGDDREGPLIAGSLESLNSTIGRTVR